MFSSSGMLLLATAIPAVLAKTLHVNVGENGELSFYPQWVRASPGDIVRFAFHPKNHTVTQSAFPAGDPCSKSAHGMHSDFQFVAAEGLNLPTYDVHVKNSDPVWFYCEQTAPKSHCAAGMVFAINPPSRGDNTYTAFKNLAKKSTVQSKGSKASSSSNSQANPQAATYTSDQVASHDSGSTTTHWWDPMSTSEPKPSPTDVDSSGTTHWWDDGNSLMTTATGTETDSDTETAASVTSASSSGTDAAATTTASDTDAAATTTASDTDAATTTSDTDAAVTATASDGSKLLTSNLEGDNASTGSSNDYSTLLRNGYVIIGLLAGVILLLITLVIVLAVRGGAKITGKSKYSQVATGGPSVPIFDSSKPYSTPYADYRDD